MLQYICVCVEQFDAHLKQIIRKHCWNYVRFAWHLLVTKAKWLMPCKVKIVVVLQVIQFKETNFKSFLFYSGWYMCFERLMNHWLPYSVLSSQILHFSFQCWQHLGLFWTSMYMVHIKLFCFKDLLPLQERDGNWGGPWCMRRGFDARNIHGNIYNENSE